MSLEEAYFASQIISAITVVVSVLYLAVQIRQTNQISRSAVVSELQKKYIDFYNVVLSNEDLATLLAKLTDPDYKTESGPENQKLEILAMLTGSIWFSAQTSFDQGLITTETFKAYCEGVTARLEQWPAMRPYLLKMFRRYPSQAGKPIFQPIFKEHQEDQIAV